MGLFFKARILNKYLTPRGTAYKALRRGDIAA